MSVDVGETVAVDQHVHADRLTLRAAPLFATVITAAVMIGFLVVGFVYIALDDQEPVRLASAAVALLAVFVLQVGVISNPERDPGRWTGLAALLGQVLIAGLTPWFGYGWLLIMGFIAGSSLLVLPRRVRWPAFAAVCIADVAATSALVPVDAVALLYTTLSTVGTGLTVYGLTRLRQIAVELNGTRVATADLATAREHLRLSHQFHGTIGHQLSSVALNVQLAQRLLRRDPGRAAAVATGTVATARAALADVRTAARRYREPDLDNVIVAARVTLEAAGLQVTVRSPGASVPVEVGAVLGTVLRVAVDDIIGAERVRRCTLEACCVGGRAVLEVHDDRPDGCVSPVPTDLREAVQAVEGTITRSVESDLVPGSERYRLRVEVPLSAGLADGAGEPEQPPARRTLPLLPFAQTILVVVLAAYAVNGALFVVLSALDPISAAIGVATIAALLVLQLAVISRRGIRAGHRLGALAAQAALSAGSVALLADPYVGLPGFVAGSALLALPRWVRWPAFVAVVLAVTAAQGVLVGTPEGVVYGVSATVNHGLVIFGLTRLRDLVDALVTARADVAALAVARERLRFTGDLHDLLGYGLSAIALKCELASRLALIDPERAQSELDDVLGVSGRALADVRSVTGHRQQLDLAVELGSVRSVLDAAGVELRRADVGDPATVPATAGTLLATVLREAVTNLLRHSNARTCTITVEAGSEVVLEVVNDGASCDGPDRGPGTGLASLGVRAASLGGTFHAGPEGGDRFIVRVRVPRTVRTAGPMGRPGWWWTAGA